LAIQRPSSSGSFKKNIIKTKQVGVAFGPYVALRWQNLPGKYITKIQKKNRRKTLHNFFNQVSNEMEKFSLCTSFCFYFYRQPNDKFICYLADFHEQLLHTLHTDTTALNTHKHTHTHNDSGTVVNMVFVAWFLAHAHSARNDVGC